MFTGRHPDRRLQRRKRGAPRARGCAPAASRASLHMPMPRACSSTTRPRGSRSAARQALAAMADGDTLRTMLAALRRLLKWRADQHGHAAAASCRRSRRSRRIHLLNEHSSLRSRPDCLVALAACGHASPRRTRSDYAQRIADDRAAKDELFTEQQRSDSGREEGRAAAARVLPDRSRLRRARRRSTPSDDQHGHRDADVHRRAAEDAKGRDARVLAEGPAASHHGVLRSDRRPRVTCP